MGSLEVETTGGRVRGARTGGTRVFRGIPYAASTAGASRWRPPAPPTSWAGVRDATVFAPVAPQVELRAEATGRRAAWLDLLYPGYGTPLEGRPMSEDCCSLNLWTPEDDGAGRPVMVWLHGGRFQHGTAVEAMFHADRLVAREDVVVVSVGHRLGLLGYLGLGPLAGEDEASAGVAGMLDLVAALEWVRDNVAAFGGDPGNVTIFGQSGGGNKVSVLLAMPAAQGLFHKAIIQSGPGLRALDPDEGAEVALELCAALGVPSDAPERLRSVPLGALLEHEANLLRTAGAFGDRRASALAVKPVVEGHALPGHPYDPVAAPTAAGIPLLVGTVADEAACFVLGDPAYGPSLTSDDVAARLRPMLGEATGAVLAAYEAVLPELAPYRRFARILSDNAIRLPSLQLAERHQAAGGPTYLYRFGYETPVLDGVLGSCHSVEIPFVLGTIDRIPAVGGRGDRAEVAERTGRAWASFARSGDPGARDGAPWPTFDPVRRTTMCIGNEWHPVADLDGPALEALAASDG